MAIPKFAQIDIQIGDKVIHVTHKNLYSFNTDRTAKDICDKFSISILDDDVFTIESYLLNGNNEITITYIDNVRDYDYLLNNNAGEDGIKFDEFKTFNGFITNMSEAFVDNRIMLTISGIMSIGLKKKYDQYSVAWNTVPRFDMKELLGYWTYANDVDALYGTKKKADQIWEEIQRLGEFATIGSLTTIVNALENNSKDAKDRSDENIGEWEPSEYMRNLVKWNAFFTDEAGNYYTIKNTKGGKQALLDLQKHYADRKKNGTYYANAVFVKAIGTYTIPIRIDKLLKLICCGGNYSELLEKSYKEYLTNYGEISFIQENLSLAEWALIQEWYIAMGKFEGLGFETFDSGNYKALDLYQGELSQVKQSYTDFIYNVLLPKCSYTAGGKTFANFYLTFDNKTVKLDRIDTSKIPSADKLPEYTYYGPFSQAQVENNPSRSLSGTGILTSFSPKLDILTSMLTNNTVANSQSDISSLSLVSTDSSGNTQTVKSVASDYLYYTENGPLSVSNTPTGTGNKQESVFDSYNILEKAQSLPYTATATISGYNCLNPQEYIHITVIPSAKEGNSFTHHTSGTYFIIGIKDTLQNGQWTSELSLVKNVQSIGTTAINKSISNINKDIAFTMSDQETAPTKDDLKKSGITPKYDNITEMQYYSSYTYTKDGKRAFTT